MHEGWLKILLNGKKLEMCPGDIVAPVVLSLKYLKKGPLLCKSLVVSNQQLTWPIF